MFLKDLFYQKRNPWRLISIQTRLFLKVFIREINNVYNIYAVVKALRNYIEIGCEKVNIDAGTYKFLNRK